MPLKPLFAFFLMVLAAPLAANVIRHDVEDGAYRASEADFPFLFALYRSRAGHRDCVATLIDRRWAVTAAHCTQDKAFLEALGPGGRGHRVEIGAESFTVDRVERHPPGSDGRAVDLALLRLSRPVTHVKPIAISREADELGRVVLLPGWGTTGDGLKGVGKADGLFRVVENRVDAAGRGVLVWEFDDPRSGIGRALPLEGINGPGDSGGPALVMTPRGWRTIGVSMGQRTFGRPEGSYGNEEIYVRLSEYAAWIDGFTGRAEARP